MSRKRYTLVEGLCKIVETIQNRPRPLLDYWARVDEKKQAEKMEVIGVDKEKWL